MFENMAWVLIIVFFVGGGTTSHSAANMSLDKCKKIAAGYYDTTQRRDGFIARASCYNTLTGEVYLPQKHGMQPYKEAQ